MMQNLLSNPRTRFIVLTLIALVVTFFTVSIRVGTEREASPFSVGDQIQTEQTVLTLEELDFTPEPGEITTEDELEKFYLRQDSLSLLLADKKSSAPLKLSSMTTLPLLFWVQIIVGLLSFLISGQIWALRPRDLSSRFFFLSGVSTLLFTFASAVYTTRYFPIHSDLFKPLVYTNMFGASLFGISMISLFLVYPIRLPHWKLLCSITSLVFGIWTILAIAQIVPLWAGGNFITLIEMIFICVAVLFQFLFTKKLPRDRASLTWLGLSVVMGAGFFISINALPLVLGLEVSMAQGYAFLGFLGIYIGLYAGLKRYRLFEVGHWAFTLFFYSAGALLLLLLDAALVYFLGFERFPSLGISLLSVGFIYLPLRDFLQRKMTHGKTLEFNEQFSESLYVGFAPNSFERKKRLHMLFQKLFSPLEIQEMNSDTEDVQIVDDGLGLIIPSIAGNKSFQVSYPWKGSRLFNLKSLEISKQIVMFVKQVESSREAYDRGVLEERLRMAQDLHDDLGSKLLNSLYLADGKAKDSLVGAIEEMREIVSGVSNETKSLDIILAELRSESFQRLSVSNINLDWDIIEEDSNIILDYRLAKAIRSSLREVINNAIKHSGASEVKVDIKIENQDLKLKVKDNGRGFSKDSNSSGSSGFGFKSIRKRIEEVKGQLGIESDVNGTLISIFIPLAD
jgi:signal transduction histidine kinase